MKAKITDICGISKKLHINIYAHNFHYITCMGDVFIFFYPKIKKNDVRRGDIWQFALNAVPKQIKI